MLVAVGRKAEDVVSDGFVALHDLQQFNEAVDALALVAALHLYDHRDQRVESLAGKGRAVVQVGHLVDVSERIDSLVLHGHRMSGLHLLRRASYSEDPLQLLLLEAVIQLDKWHESADVLDSNVHRRLVDLLEEHLNDSARLCQLVFAHHSELFAKFLGLNTGLQDGA